MCTCLQTQLTTELNQELTKSMPRRHSIPMTYCKNLGVKERGGDLLEGGGHLLEGGVFSETYST